MEDKAPEPGLFDGILEDEGAAPPGAQRLGVASLRSAEFSALSRPPQDLSDRSSLLFAEASLRVGQERAGPIQRRRYGGLAWLLAILALAGGVAYGYRSLEVRQAQETRAQLKRLRAAQQRIEEERLSNIKAVSLLKGRPPAPR